MRTFSAAPETHFKSITNIVGANSMFTIVRSPSYFCYISTHYLGPFHCYLHRQLYFLHICFVCVWIMKEMENESHSISPGSNHCQSVRLRFQQVGWLCDIFLPWWPHVNLYMSRLGGGVRVNLLFVLHLFPFSICYQSVLWWLRWNNSSLVPKISFTWVRGYKIYKLACVSLIPRAFRRLRLESKERTKRD